MAAIHQLSALIGVGLSVTLCCVSSTKVLAVPILGADFDDNGIVDADDLLLWDLVKYTFDTVADANGDGVSDVDDLIIWKQQEGVTTALAPVSAATNPHLQYNPGNGQLSIVAVSYDVFAFNVTMLSAPLASVTDANLPGSWDVQQFNATVQAFDTSILGDPSPVVSDFPLSVLSGPAVIAQLPTGLSSVAATLHYGLTDNTDGFSTLVTIVPEPNALALIAGAVVVMMLRRPAHLAADQWPGAK